MPQPRGRTPGAFGGRVLSIGRWLGIEICIDPSWFLIFGLLTWALGQNYREWRPDWAPALAWSAGLVASLLYFLSILLHELGHSIASRLLGLPVTSITLFIFGGLARLAGEPKRPRDELLIAIAGPAVNVLLGMFFAALWLGSPGGEVVGSVSGWLSAINFALAAFNSIPGYPLDGGHVLRAVLWKITGSADRATRWAGTVGAIFAQLIIVLGLVRIILGGDWLGGIFIALVGWFLLRAARSSVLRTVIKHHLERISVAEAMEHDLPAVDAWETVEDVAEGPLAGQGKSFLFVTEEGEPRGVVALEQIEAIPAARRAFLRISQIMTTLPGPDTIEPGGNLLDALSRMDQKGTNCLPVLSAGGLVGILTRQRVTTILQNRMSRKSRGRD